MSPLLYPCFKQNGWREVAGWNRVDVRKRRVNKIKDCVRFIFVYRIYVSSRKITTPRAKDYIYKAGFIRLLFNTRTCNDIIAYWLSWQSLWDTVWFQGRRGSLMVQSFARNTEYLGSTSRTGSREALLWFTHWFVKTPCVYFSWSDMASKVQITAWISFDVSQTPFIKTITPFLPILQPYSTLSQLYQLLLNPFSALSLSPRPLRKKM